MAQVEIESKDYEFSQTYCVHLKDICKGITCTKYNSCSRDCPDILGIGLSELQAAAEKEVKWCLNF